MYRFSKIISDIFNPLIVPLLAAAYILFSGSVYSLDPIPLKAKFYLFGVLALFMFFMPLLTILILKSMGMAETLHLPKREQRFIPFVLSALFYYAAYYTLSLINGLPQIIPVLLLSGIVLLGIAILFTLWYQISIHTMCMGSLVAILTYLSYFYFADTFSIMLLSIVVSGLVGMSRLVLNAHKPYQIYSGFLVGLAVQYISLIFFTIYF